RAAAAPGGRAGWLRRSSAAAGAAGRSTGGPAAPSPVAAAAPPLPAPPPPLPFTVASKRTYRRRPVVDGLSLTRISTVFRLGSVTYCVSIVYLPLLAVAVTEHAMPPLSGAESTVSVLSRVWRAVKVFPSVTTYWSVSTFVLSTVG